MNSQQLIEKYIQKIKATRGLERAVEHKEIDNLLCELLSELGYQEVVKEYKKPTRWYA